MGESGVDRARLRIHIQLLGHHKGLELPSYQTDGASGMDLRAALIDPLELAPGHRALVPTGIKIAIPPGFEAQIRPRSGLAIRLGLGMVNAPGTIDADYRGEIKVPLINLGQESIRIDRGMRIAQIVVGPVVRFAWQETSRLPQSDRGDGGFGHTGNR